MATVQEELPRCPATTQSRGNEPTGELDRGPRSSSVFRHDAPSGDSHYYKQIKDISAIGSANAESRVQTPGGLCRVNWEVRARLSLVGEYILGSSARPMVYDRGETALPRILCVDPVCRR